MADPLVTLADVQAVFPPDVVGAVFSDDGTGIAGPRFETARRIASRLGEAILRKAWPGAPQLTALVAEDEAVKAMFCHLVMAEGVSVKPEWSGPEAPFAHLRKQAIQMFERYAQGQARPLAETADGVGKNPNVGSSLTVATPERLFVPNARNPRAGGGF